MKVKAGKIVHRTSAAVSRDSLALLSRWANPRKRLPAKESEPQTQVRGQPGGQPERQPRPSSKDRARGAQQTTLRFFATEEPPASLLLAATVRERAAAGKTEH